MILFLITWERTTLFWTQRADIILESIFLQVLSFTCTCCFFFSRHALYTSSLIILWCLLHCSPALHQWCPGCNLQHSDLWDNCPLEASSRWKKSHSLCSCSSSIPSALVFHFSLLYWCGITHCSACYISDMSEEELPVKCTGTDGSSLFPHAIVIW